MEAFFEKVNETEDAVVFRTIDGSEEYRFNNDGDLVTHGGGYPHTALSGWWLRRFATFSGGWQIMVSGFHSTHLYEVKIFGPLAEVGDKGVEVATFYTRDEAEALQEVLVQHMNALEVKVFQEVLEAKEEEVVWIEVVGVEEEVNIFGPLAEKGG